MHVEELQTADRPWEIPNHDDMAVLPQLEVDGPSGFDAVLGSFKAKTGIGVDAIHPSMWSRISEKGKQLYSHLLIDSERTLKWLAQIQTLIYFLVPKTPTGERPTDSCHQSCECRNVCAHSGSMDEFPDPALRLGVQRSVGRNGGMATLGAGGRARRQTRYGQGHGALGHDEVL